MKHQYINAVLFGGVFSYTTNYLVVVSKICTKKLFVVVEKNPKGHMLQYFSFEYALV
jgi:hypothetical protein